MRLQVGQDLQPYHMFVIVFGVYSLSKCAVQSFEIHDARHTLDTVILIGVFQTLDAGVKLEVKTPPDRTCRALEPPKYGE